MGVLQMKYLLDTHTWIWWHTNPKNLSEKVIDIISNPNNYEALLLSAISVWEFCKLLEKGRIGVSLDPNDWLDQALDMQDLILIPLTPIIAYKSTTLHKPFHNDPADQIIVATAIEEKATILTKDEKILRYKSVNSLW
jgi:PIN domain nuclease of toxin-antitoxin system